MKKREGRADLNLFRREEVPVLLEGATLGLLVVDENLVRVVGLQDQRVEVREHIVLQGTNEQYMKRTEKAQGSIQIVEGIIVEVLREERTD